MLKVEYIGDSSGQMIPWIGSVWKGKPFECSEEAFEKIPNKQDYKVLSGKPKPKGSE